MAPRQRKIAENPDFSASLVPLNSQAAPPPPQAGRRLENAQRAEIARIVRRLEAIVTMHLEGARRIKHPLTAAHVLAVIDALRLEAEGGNRPVSFSDGEITFYLMDSLYEELLGEPSNIFSETKLPDGGVRIEPLQRSVWLACLAGLRERMARLARFPIQD